MKFSFYPLSYFPRGKGTFNWAISKWKYAFILDFEP
jgi:hypothetical protein